MKRYLFLAVVVGLVNFSVSANAGDIERFCAPRGSMKELECDVPMTVLIARGDEFNGKTVAVTGYLANGPMPILFASSEDFSTSNVVNGTVVRVRSGSKIAQRLFDLNHRLVTIKGRYDVKPVDLGGYSADRVSGSISDIQAVGDAYSPWGYVETNAPPTVKP